MLDFDHIASPDPNRSPDTHMGDDDLQAAYERISGEPGDAEADAILAEIERRGLDL